MILLTDEGIWGVLHHGGDVASPEEMAGRVAKAQLKKVVEDIDKALVKYSVVDGKLSHYIEGTVPLWALPDELWQSLLEEVV